MSNKIDKILAEISAGELFDKITILEIKKIKISNKEINYKEAMLFMETKVRDISKNNSKELLWFLNHNHIFTQGTSASNEEDIITKPLYGNGGEGIHRFDKTNFNPKILDEYLHLPIMVQKFINEIEHGDRRIIFFDGEYFGSVARIPQEGNLKANFHAGGKASKTDLVYRDKEIIENLGPKLKEHNLFFVGIDIIGNYLTEINVTSPTGLKQINALNNVKLEKDFWDKLEAKYKLV